MSLMSELRCSLLSVNCTVIHYKISPPPFLNLPGISPIEGEVSKHDESLDEELSQEEVEEGRKILVEKSQLDELEH